VLKSTSCFLSTSRHIVEPRGHSTETAVLCLYNDIVRAVDEKHIAAFVLLDLSVAFDTVDHATLLTVGAYCNEGSASVARRCNGLHHTLRTGHRSFV